MEACIPAASARLHAPPLSVWLLALGQCAFWLVMHAPVKNIGRQKEAVKEATLSFRQVHMLAREARSCERPKEEYTENL